jgi:CubicO group peptidase (beta-lactamase class C family)
MFDRPTAMPLIFAMTCLAGCSVHAPNGDDLREKSKPLFAGGDAPVTGINVSTDNLMLALPAPPMNFKAAADYSAMHGGGAMIVAIDGLTVFERYDDGQRPSTAFSTASGGKSFWGIATLIMINQGLLSLKGDLTRKASRVINEWRGTEKDEIRLWHLPYLAAGLQNCGSCYGDFIDPDGQRVTDTFHYAINDQDLVRPPGATFEYGAVNHFVWGSVIERLTGLDPKTYLEREMLAPLGMTISYWAHDDAGNPRMHGGYRLTARDYLKFGNLVARRGRLADGTQLIPPRLFDLLSARQGPNPGHAMFFWQNDPNGEDAAGYRSPAGSRGGPFYENGYPEMFAALGGGKVNQVLAIFPRHRMVVLRLRQCNRPNKPNCGAPNKFEISQFFSRLFETN